MRRFFSLSTVFLTLFCIVNIQLPLGSFSVLFSVLTLIFAFVLYRLSKTSYKKKLPMVLMGINIVLAIVFLLKPVFVKDKVVLEEALLTERSQQERKAQRELDLLEKTGILGGLNDLDNKTPPTMSAANVNQLKVGKKFKKDDDDTKYVPPAFN